MRSRSLLRKGEPSAYGFVCGYTMEHERDGVRTVLWQECPEIRAYHLRQHDHNTGVRVFWHVYGSLTEAKRAFRAAKAGRPVPDPKESNK